MVNAILTKEKIWNSLAEIADPDIPVISITELGLVRNVEIDSKEKVTISLTPSYSGCPAMQFFKEEIISVLKNKGFNNVEVKTVYSPAWTTEWITAEAKDKMKKHGITPPETISVDTPQSFTERKSNTACAWCSAKDTKLISQFGSTPCKAMWFCNSCCQPFEAFKCI